MQATEGMCLIERPEFSDVIFDTEEWERVAIRSFHSDIRGLARDGFVNIDAAMNSFVSARNDLRRCLMDNHRISEKRLAKIQELIGKIPQLDAEAEAALLAGDYARAYEIESRFLSSRSLREINERLLFQAGSAHGKGTSSLKERIDSRLSREATGKLISHGILDTDIVTIHESGPVSFRKKAKNVKDVLDQSFHGTECTEAKVLLERKDGVSYACVIGVDDRNMCHVSVTSATKLLPSLNAMGSESLRKSIRSDASAMRFLAAQSAVNLIFEKVMSDDRIASESARTFLSLYDESWVPSVLPKVSIEPDRQFLDNLCAISGTLYAVTRKSFYLDREVSSACSAIRPASEFLSDSILPFLSGHGVALDGIPHVNPRDLSGMFVNELTRPIGSHVFRSTEEDRISSIKRFCEHPGPAVSLGRRLLSLMAERTVEERDGMGRTL